MAHQGPINNLVVSPDFKYCFTAGEDGNMFVFKINEERIPESHDTKSLVT